MAWIPTHDENFVNNKTYEFAVTDRETGELYGAMGLGNNQKHKNGEIAYWIGEEYWGNGYATEAARAVIDFAFNEKGYHRVWGKFLDLAMYGIINKHSNGGLNTHEQNYSK